jgi:hypothetical protein
MISNNGLLSEVKIGNVIILIPNIKNTQFYSDNESSKADKLSHKMHDFVTKKRKKIEKNVLKN